MHPLAQPLDYEPLGTFDTDIAVPLDLPTTGEQIRARLLERNFREELMGDMQPPAAHYRVETGDDSFYAEFLTPLEGSAVKRGGPESARARIAEHEAIHEDRMSLGHRMPHSRKSIGG